MIQSRTDPSFYSCCTAVAAAPPCHHEPAHLQPSNPSHRGSLPWRRPQIGLALACYSHGATTPALVGRVAGTSEGVVYVLLPCGRGTAGGGRPDEESRIWAHLHVGEEGTGSLGSEEHIRRRKRLLPVATVPLYASMISGGRHHGIPIWPLLSLRSQPGPNLATAEEKAQQRHG